jgi:spore maturation protein A
MDPGGERMNTIWLILVAVSILFAALGGRIDAFTKALFEAGKAAVEVCLYLVGIVSLWLGLTKILEDCGIIYKMSNFFRPVMSLIFRRLPAGHPAITNITLNLLANVLGIGNAATPLGIKAMEDLQTLNPTPDTVTFEMMLFIVINTASVQLIPFTVIGLLASYGSQNPNRIMLPTFIATVVSACTAVGILFLFRKIYERKA